MDIRTYFNQRAAHWDDGEQSVDQIRRMIAFLSDIQEGMSVLDVACGTGAMFEALRERKPSHITAVDLSEKMIEIAARKVEGDSLFELQCRDLFEMTQETFDRIIIYNAYPHFMEKDKVVQKVAELLNPGGSVRSDDKETPPSDPSSCDGVGGGAGSDSRTYGGGWHP